MSHPTTPNQYTAPPTFLYPAIAETTPENPLPKRITKAEYFRDPKNFFGLNVTVVDPVVGPHWHPNADEFDYFLEGEGIVTIVETTKQGTAHTFKVKAGDAIVIPQGYAHSYLNQSPKGHPPLKFLAVFNNSEFRLINTSAVPDPQEA